jgi:hypothetical protein
MIPSIAMEFDRSEKRRQAAQVYAGMTDEELQELAAEARSLTEIGKEALRSELARRRLETQFSEATVPAEKTGTDGLVTLRQFRDIPEALLAKGALESAGIESFLGDESIIRMDWLWSNALGGVKLWVRKEDADVAAQLLDQGIPDGLDVTGIGEYNQPRCPNCESLDISFEDLNKPLTYTSIFVGVPIPVSRHRWKCESCGHVWQDSNETTPQTSS